MGIPVILAAVNPQVPEQFLFSQKNGLQGRDQQTFSKTPGAGQKINHTLCNQTVNVAGPHR